MEDHPVKLIKDDGTQAFTSIFGQMDGGQVLDIATGPGGFVGILKQFLKSYNRITGIDLRQDLLDKANQTFPDENIFFEVMDASQMSFPDEQFDLVCCAFSLHHLVEISPVLDEIKRVLKPSGTAVFVEMYKARQSEAQLTEVSIHHFSADIDMGHGIHHNHTFDRAEILAVLESRFEVTAQYDFADLTQDAKDPQTRQTIDRLIDTLLERAEDLPDYPKFERQAEALHKRLAEVGTHPASRLVVVGRKKV